MSEQTAVYDQKRTAYRVSDGTRILVHQGSNDAGIVTEYLLVEPTITGEPMEVVDSSESLEELLTRNKIKILS